MGRNSVGLILIVFGLGLVLLGIIIRTGALSWFGKLPGDIRIEKENFKLYIPLVSMAVLSVALTILINLVRRLFY